MLIAFWGAKGGAGATTVAVLVGALWGQRSGPRPLIADLGGDVPAVLGLSEPQGAGLTDWIRAGAQVSAEALKQLEVDAGSFGLLPLGDGTLDGHGEPLAAALASLGRPVIADCGSRPEGVQRGVAASVPRSVLVTRPCYLALRRAALSSLRPSEVIVVDEPGRALRPVDIESALGAPVVAVVPFDPAVSRAVDAGLLGARPPRAVMRRLEAAA